MASGEVAMSEKAPPWAPPPLISFKSGSSSTSCRRFRSSGNRGSPAKAPESKPEEHQGALVSGPEKDRENTQKQEGLDATPKKPEQNPSPPAESPVASSQGFEVHPTNLEHETKLFDGMEEGELPEKPELASKPDDFEEGELPDVKMDMQVEVQITNSETKEELADAMEEGELPAQDFKNEKPELGIIPEERKLRADVKMEMQVDEEELEEGELPSSEAADVMERNRETHTPAEEIAKTGSPILGLINSPAFDPQLEFTLADWHLHVTTGKPLPRREAPKPPENPASEATKKKKRRKRKKPGNNNEPGAKKQKTQNTSSPGKVQPGRVVPAAGATTTPVLKKVEPVVNPKVELGATISPKVEAVEVKIERQEAPADVKQEQPAAPSPKKPEVKPEPEKEMTLTMMIEKELGIWTDPVEEKQKKKRVLTAERKKKKKANERIKRAEKDREMGIARRPRVVFKAIEKPLQVCKYFLKGRCSKGESCTFSHEVVPETKQYLCKYFLTHCCLKGEDCPFSHEPANFPCKFLITRGFCKDGDECRFSHKPISDEERDKLLKRVLSERKEHEAKVYEEPMFPAPGGDDAPEYEPDFNPELREPEYDPAPASAWWKPSSGGAEDYDPAPAPLVDELNYNNYSTAEDESEAVSSDSWWLTRRAEEDKKLAAFEASKPSCSGAGEVKSKSNIMDLLQQTMNESGGVF